MKRLEEVFRRYRRVEKDLVLFLFDFTEAHRSKMFRDQAADLPYVVSEDDLEAWGVEWIAKRFPHHERPAGLPCVLSQAQNGGVITAFPSLLHELLKRDEAGSLRQEVDSAHLMRAEELARRQPVQGCIWDDQLVAMTNAHAEMLEKARDAYLRGDPMMAVRDIVTNTDSPIWNGPRGRLDGAAVSVLPIYRIVSEIAKVRGIEQGLLREDAAPRLPTPPPAKKWIN